MHEGPRDRALQHDGLPQMNSVVPHFDSEGAPLANVDGAIIYSKGASVLAMLEARWEDWSPGVFKVLLSWDVLKRAPALCCYCTP